MIENGMEVLAMPCRNKKGNFYSMGFFINDSDYISAETRNKSCLDATSGNEFHRHSESCQFLDIGSHNQLSNEQKRCESEQKQSISEQTRSFARNVPYRKPLVTRESYTDG